MADFATGLLNLNAVIALTGMSRATIYRCMNNGLFPPPLVHHGQPRVYGWAADDVHKWFAVREQLQPKRGRPTNAGVEQPWQAGPWQPYQPRPLTYRTCKRKKVWAANKGEQNA